MAEDGLIFCLSLAHSCDELFGDDQHMNRGLWLHIMKSDTVFVFVGDVGWDLAIDDFLKDRLGYSWKAKRKGAKRQSNKRNRNCRLWV